MTCRNIGKPGQAPFFKPLAFLLRFTKPVELVPPRQRQQAVQLISGDASLERIGDLVDRLSARDSDRASSDRHGTAGGTSPVEFERRHSQRLTGV